MFFITAIFTVMVSACGTMEGDVNVSDDSKDKIEKKTDTPATEEPTIETETEPDTNVEASSDENKNENEEAVNNTNNDSEPEVEVNVNVDVDVDANNDDENPETTGKLRKGMTKAEVLQFFPEPDTIDSWFGWTRWTYIDNDDDICVKKYNGINNDCRLFFSTAGNLRKVEDVKGSRIDLTSF